MSLSYWLLRAFISLVYRLFTDYHVSGRENVPLEGPLILAMNHIHTLDSPAAMVAMPRQVTTFAARKWRHTPKGWILTLAGAIFVNRGEVDRQALRAALDVLKRGGVLGLAPEGTRSPTFQLQSARGGVAYLAYLSGARILPVAVTGVEHMLPSLRHLRRARVRVVIGQPFALPAFAQRPKAGDLLQQADLVMRRIAALLPPEYQGVYAEGRALVRRTPAPQG